MAKRNPGGSLNMRNRDYPPHEEPKKMGPLDANGLHKPTLDAVLKILDSSARELQIHIEQLRGLGMTSRYRPSYYTRRGQSTWPIGMLLDMEHEAMSAWDAARQDVRDMGAAREPLPAQSGVKRKPMERKEEE